MSVVSEGQLGTATSREQITLAQESSGMQTSQQSPGERAALKPSPQAMAGQETLAQLPVQPLITSLPYWSKHTWQAPGSSLLAPPAGAVALKYAQSRSPSGSQLEKITAPST